MRATGTAGHLGIRPCCGLALPLAGLGAILWRQGKPRWRPEVCAASLMRLMGGRHGDQPG